MKKNIHKTTLSIFSSITLALAFVLIPFQHTASAASCAPVSAIGVSTNEVSVPSDGIYRIWSRVMPTDATNNSFWLEIDGTTCILVGDTPLAANKWAWVDNQQGIATTKIDVTLKTGKHTIKAIGRESSVKVDRIMALLDKACVPTGMGDNCTAASTDTTPPSVPQQLKAAAASPTQINLSWTPSTDPSGIAGYDVFRSGDGGSAQKIATVTTVSFGDAQLKPATKYTYYVTARDMANNSSASSATSEATTPSIPSNVQKVTGKLTARDDEQLGNAQIIVRSGHGERHIYATTADGSYTVQDLKPGTYTFKYKARGYNPKTITLRVSAGQTITKNVVLRMR
ncbi:MAG TPA: carboxypeptidase regulatory-like domain-containing protein [Candidatus Saccharimonadales bacterium]|nr:carboxypeptidase regulatory-like domain-containing protein [Candidatus Saccharimonadales bacterium]